MRRKEEGGERWRSWSIGRKIFEIPGEPRDDSISQRPLNGPLWTMRHHRPRSFSVFEGRTFFVGGRLCRLRHLHRTPSTTKKRLGLFDFSYLVPDQSMVLTNHCVNVVDYFALLTSMPLSSLFQLGRSPYLLGQARIGAASYREKLGGPIQIGSYRLKISCFQLIWLI